MERTAGSFTPTAPSLSPLAQRVTSHTKVINCSHYIQSGRYDCLARMFNRENAPNEPYVCIRDYYNGRDIMYAEHAASPDYLAKILKTEGGMDVFVRNTK